MLAAAGVLAGLAVVVFMAAGSVEWGPPGTDAYSGYATVNRLVSLPWIACAIVLVVLLRYTPRLGVAITFAGAILIVVGNVAEFWFLNDASYADTGRRSAWSMFLAGHLVFLIGYATAWWQAQQLTHSK